MGRSVGVSPFQGFRNLEGLSIHGLRVLARRGRAARFAHGNKSAAPWGLMTCSGAGGLVLVFEAAVSCRAEGMDGSDDDDGEVVMIAKSYRAVQGCRVLCVDEGEGLANVRGPRHLCGTGICAGSA